MSKKPVMLMILDGFGLGKEYEGNAVYLAKKPNYDKIVSKYPHSTLYASGLYVGLPEGQMGNSEVGHLNIGSGRIVYQELTRISKEIREGNFFKKEEFLNAIAHAKENHSKLHLIGLVSDGGVHSHNTHLYALLELMKKQDFNDVYIHTILDGRDVPPTIGSEHLRELEAKIKEIGVGKIATVSGRYYAMDRDKRWDRVKLAYDAIALGIGKAMSNPIDVVESSYKEGVNDEFVLPTVILEDNKPVATIEDNDSIIFFNFRPDRARELTRAIIDDEFTGFERPLRKNLYYVTMTEYDKTIPHVHVAYKTENLVNTLGETISKLGLNQLRIAETEKYAHVTFFFNGGREVPFENEDRVLIPSPKVATYDLKPEMSAYEVKDEAIRRIKSGKYDLIILNFANPDMVGHTGVIPAAVKAIETVDECMGEILEVMHEVGGEVLVTADHGNSEYMLDEVTKTPVTSHTSNKVPFILVSDRDVSLKDGILADIAPTILHLLDIEKPSEMTGETLIIEK